MDFIKPAVKTIIAAAVILSLFGSVRGRTSENTVLIPLEEAHVQIKHREERVLRSR